MITSSVWQLILGVSLILPLLSLYLQFGSHLHCRIYQHIDCWQNWEPNDSAGLSKPSPFFLPGKLRESGTWTHILWSIIPGLAFSRSESNTPRKLCPECWTSWNPSQNNHPRSCKIPRHVTLWELSIAKKRRWASLTAWFLSFEWWRKTSEKHAAA